MLKKNFKATGEDSIGIIDLMHMVWEFAEKNPQLGIPHIDFFELQKVLEGSDRILLACNGERAMLKYSSYSGEEEMV